MGRTTGWGDYLGDLQVKAGRWTRSLTARSEEALRMHYVFLPLPTFFLPPLPLPSPSSPSSTSPYRSPKRPAANRKVVASGRRKSSSESLPHKRMARKKKWGSVASSETDGSSMSGALKSAMSAPGGRSRLWGRQQEVCFMSTSIIMT